MYLQHVVHAWNHSEAEFTAGNSTVLSPVHLPCAAYRLPYAAEDLSCAACSVSCNGFNESFRVSCACVAFVWLLVYHVPQGEDPQISAIWSSILSLLGYQILQGTGGHPDIGHLVFLFAARNSTVSTMSYFHTFFPGAGTAMDDSPATSHHPLVFRQVCRLT